MVFLRQAVGDERGEQDEQVARRVHEHMLLLYTELMQYPAGAHDDVLDSMQNAFQLAASSVACLKNGVTRRRV